MGQIVLFGKSLESVLHGACASNHNGRIHFTGCFEQDMQPFVVAQNANKQQEIVAVTVSHRLAILLAGSGIPALVNADGNHRHLVDVLLEEGTAGSVIGGGGDNSVHPLHKARHQWAVEKIQFLLPHHIGEMAHYGRFVPGFGTG